MKQRRGAPGAKTARCPLDRESPDAITTSVTYVCMYLGKVVKDTPVPLAAHDIVDGAGDVASTATGHMQELVA